MMSIFGYEEKFCFGQANWTGLWGSQNKERAIKTQLLQDPDTKIYWKNRSWNLIGGQVCSQVWEIQDCKCE